jgi:hypothetical protein
VECDSSRNETCDSRDRPAAGSPEVPRCESSCVRYAAPVLKPNLTAIFWSVTDCRWDCAQLLATFAGRPARAGGRPKEPAHAYDGAISCEFCTRNLHARQFETVVRRESGNSHDRPSRICSALKISIQETIPAVPVRNPASIRGMGIMRPELAGPSDESKRLPLISVRRENGSLPMPVRRVLRRLLS